MQLNFSVMKYHGDQLEISRAYQLGGQPAKLQILYFGNVARMSSYQDVLNYTAAYGGPPEVGNVCKSNASLGFLGRAFAVRARMADPF